MYSINSIDIHFYVILMFQRENSYVPFSASVSTGVALAVGALVKNVPIFLPSTIDLIAFSCMPLQITTETPLFKAHVAACT